MIKINFAHQDELCPECGELSIASDKRPIPSGWWGAVYVHDVELGWHHTGQNMYLLLPEA
jgi:hypothetical protein